MKVKLRKENLNLLQPLLAKLAQMSKDDLSLSKGPSDRRGVARQREGATIEVRNGNSGFVSAPLIEYSQFGARLVLSNVSIGQSLDFVISTARRTVSGQGRVAWTSPLSNGRAVVGLELVRIVSVANQAAAV
jgi:hypothetical protein